MGGPAYNQRGVAAAGGGRMGLDSVQALPRDPPTRTCLPATRMGLLLGWGALPCLTARPGVPSLACCAMCCCAAHCTALLDTPLYEPASARPAPTRTYTARAGIHRQDGAAVSRRHCPRGAAAHGGGGRQGRGRRARGLRRRCQQRPELAAVSSPCPASAVLPLRRRCCCCCCFCTTRLLTPCSPTCTALHVCTLAAPLPRPCRTLAAPCRARAAAAAG